MLHVECKHSSAITKATERRGHGGDTGQPASRDKTAAVRNPTASRDTPPTMNIPDFVAKWKSSTLTVRSPS